MPGHCLSAIANYEGLSCFDQVGWGKVFTSPLCPGKDAALEFCRNVWSEVIALFPYEYVHIGGDEVEKDNWRKCADCQHRIAQQGLKGVEELQSWFIHEMERFFNAKGRRMIGWDEIIEGGLSKTSTVMWWRNWAPQSVPEATAHGNDVIYTPATPFYFSQNEEKSSMRQVYDYDLAPASLSAAQRAHIIGVQANLWAEGIPSRSRMLYMYFPRILALAELAWTQPAQKDYDDFYGRLRQQLSMLNRLGRALPHSLARRFPQRQRLHGQGHAERGMPGPAGRHPLHHRRHLPQRGVASATSARSRSIRPRPSRSAPSRPRAAPTRWCRPTS